MEIVIFIVGFIVGLGFGQTLVMNEAVQRGLADWVERKGFQWRQ